MAQIKQLKDVVTNQEFYPVTHKNAVIGIDDKVDVTRFEEFELATNSALDLLNQINSWQNE
jgi:hypothetical protein